MKHLKLMILLFLCGALSACGSARPEQEVPVSTAAAQTEATEETVPAPTPAPAASLLYQGHASLRITTGEGKVIYIDPYAGEGYEASADLILVTHDHYDHNALEKVTDRSADCRIITSADALHDGVYETFDLGYASVEAVQAGNNPNHDISVCVGYVIALSDGITVYVSGDTSATDQMASLKERNIDYAFFCCDGIYNMSPEEASQCASLVQAKHSIPYHTMDASKGLFDASNAEAFTADSRLIVQPGEIIELD